MKPLPDRLCIQAGSNHHTVNHEVNFINPETCKHTRLVECLWGLNKRQISIRIRGKSAKIRQTYLADYLARVILTLSHI